ncbi:MAG: hypothetical protein WC647_05065 [Desulfomonilaceae bacterium]|jgi:hypothetical protein
MQTNTDDLSYIAKAREFLDKGDLSSAVECYGKAFDPESLDEPEARNMLIEARSNLSRKFLFEALDSFEEALIVGDQIQRRQAMEGVIEIAEIRLRLTLLNQLLRSGLKALVGRKNKQIPGLGFVSENENLVLISNEAISKLPERLLRGVRIGRIPERLRGSTLPIEAQKCIPYSNEKDVDYILEVAKAIVNFKEPHHHLANHFESVSSMTGLDQTL